MQRLLLIGGGHAHVEVLRQFGLNTNMRGPAAAVTLVSPDRLTPYSGMMPGWIAGHYTRAECHIDLDLLTAFARASFVLDTVVELDLERRRALLASGGGIDFDIVSIDTGSTPPLDAVDGARTHALPVKPVGEFIEALDRLAARAARGELHRLVIVGGGAAGVEVLLAIKHRLETAGQRTGLDYSVVTESPGILPGHNARARRIFERLYAERGVAIHAGSAVAAAEPAALRLANGHTISFDAVIWATGAAAPGWPGRAGLAVDSRGFIRVDSHLRSISHPCVFGAGDVVTVDGPAYPKSGVYAVRQGPVLSANLRASAAGTPLAQYVPQARSLALVSTGDRYAVASRGRWAFGGGWVWRWKDLVDRRFMAKYALPAISSRARQ